jgi:hypothetical protein
MLHLGDGCRVISFADVPALDPCPQCGAGGFIRNGFYDIVAGRAVPRWPGSSDDHLMMPPAPPVMPIQDVPSRDGLLPGQSRQHITPYMEA